MMAVPAVIMITNADDNDDDDLKNLLYKARMANNVLNQRNWMARTFPSL